MGHSSRGRGAPARFVLALTTVLVGGIVLAACFAPAPAPSHATVSPAAPPPTSATTAPATTTTSTTTTTTTTTAPPPPACSVAVDDADAANVAVTVSTTPAEPGVQAVSQLDWSDTPSVTTTDADGVGTFTYSLIYASTFHVTVGTTQCDGHTTAIPTPPPPSCEVFVDTSNAPADVVTVKTLPLLAGVPVVVDDGTAPVAGTTGTDGLASFDRSLTPPVTLTVTVNSAAQCVAVL